MKTIEQNIIKKCNNCGQSKSAAMFHKNNFAKDGLFNECKDCRKIIAKNNYQKAKENSVVKVAEKRCAKCYEIKSSNKFYRDVTTFDGLKYSCIECCRNYKKIKYEQNSEQIKAKRKLKYRENPEKDKASSLKWYHKNAKKVISRVKKWCKDNPERHKININKSDRKRLSTPRGRLNNNVSCLMRASLKYGKDGHRWESLVPYTINNLILHLESKFTEGMSWENYGKWHVDHKIPMSAFNYTKPEHDDFKKCWSLKNLQPLWAKDNISKGAKLKKHFQPSLAFS